jgi:RNA polymerase sigma-70 factor, ECF subfamily
MSLLARRQTRAFGRLYRRHVADVYRYALVVLSDPYDAENVTRTTFLNAYRGFRVGARPRKPLNWLLGIAHRICRLRSGEIRRDEFHVEEDLRPGAENLARALGHLSFNERAALVMRELEGRTYAEIAEILGLPLEAVEVLIFRARGALREELDGSLTCHEAELAVSRALDHRISRHERRMLRAHLRSCEECAGFARDQRSQQVALRALGAVPVPPTLESFFDAKRGRFRFPEAGARAAVPLHATDTRAKKRKKAKRKVRGAAASP